MFAAAILAGCTSRPTAVSPKPAEITSLSASTFAAVWRAEVPLKTARLKRLMIDNDNVYVYSNDQQCFWFSRNGGRLMSISTIGDGGEKLYNVVSLADRVVVPTSSQLFVYDRKGKLLHSIKLKYPPSSGLAGDDKSVFLGVADPTGIRVMALATRYQPYEIPPEWQLMPMSDVTAAPATFEGSVFIGTQAGAVIGVRGYDREPLWPGQENSTVLTGGPILADLFADRDGVYVSSGDSKLYCLDLQDGRVRWAYYAGVPLREESTPVATAGSVYVYVPQRGLVAIDKTARQEIRKAKWTVQEARQFLAADDNYVYLRSADNSIIAVDKQSGEVKFRSSRNDFTVFATNTSAKDPTIFAGTADGVVYAIRPVLKPGTMGEMVMDWRAVEVAAR